MPEPETYDGPATLLTEESGTVVAVRIRGEFQPIDGHYHWFGRVAASSELDALVDSGTTVVLRTPHGDAVGRLSDRDPWGRFRIAGTGRPPFPMDDATSELSPH